MKTKGRELFKFGIVISVVSVIVAGHYPVLKKTIFIILNSLTYLVVLYCQNISISVFQSVSLESSIPNFNDEFALDLDRRVPLHRDRGGPSAAHPVRVTQDLEQALQVQVPQGSGEPAHLLLLCSRCHPRALLSW